MEEIRSLALFYKVERGGGSWGVAAASRRPLAKSDFAKRQRSLTFLLCLPSCPRPRPPAAQRVTQSGERRQEWLANFLQLTLRRHWPETKHRARGEHAHSKMRCGTESSFSLFETL